MAEVEADVYFYTQTEKLSEKKMDTVAETLTKINIKTRFETLADMLSVVKVWGTNWLT